MELYIHMYKYVYMHQRILYATIHTYVYIFIYMHLRILYATIYTHVYKYDIYAFENPLCDDIYIRIFVHVCI